MNSETLTGYLDIILYHDDSLCDITLCYEGMDIELSASLSFIQRTSLLLVDSFNGTINYRSQRYIMLSQQC